MGAERKPMIMLALFCVGLAMTSFNLIALITAAVLWVIIHPMLLWMARVDPNMVGVYLRQRRYPAHIPAFTTPFRKATGYIVPQEIKYWTR